MTIKIAIVTEREVDEAEFWQWIHALQDTGVPINGHELLETGKWTWEYIRPYQKGRDTYLLVK